MKGIPRDHINGITSAALGHTILGNSVIYPLFVALGQWIGRHLQQQAITPRAMAA